MKVRKPSKIIGNRIGYSPKKEPIPNKPAMTDSNPQNNPPSTPPEADKIMDALQKIEIFPHGVNYKPAVEQIETLLNSALIKELEAIELMRSWELVDEDFAKYLHERISQLRGKDDN